MKLLKPRFAVRITDTKNSYDGYLAIGGWGISQDNPALFTRRCDADHNGRGWGSAKVFMLYEKVAERPPAPNHRQPEVKDQFGPGSNTGIFPLN